MFRNEQRWNLIVFLAWHVIESLLHKGESSLIFSAKKLICIGEMSVPQSACLLSEVNKYTAELSLGSSRNTLSRRAQMSTEICIKLFTRRRIKGRDKRRSFPISLIFYQTILESSPQTRFMFDINKFNISNRCAKFFSPEKHRMRSICPNSVEFPKQVILLITAKQKVQVYGTRCNVVLLHNSICSCFALLPFIFITTWN